MKKRQWMALGCSMALSAVLLAGCGSNQNSVNYAQLEEIEDDGEGSSEENTTKIVRVTALNGDQITADVGELTENQKGEKPD